MQALVPSPSAEVVTRKHLSRTRLGGSSAVIRTEGEAPDDPSLDAIVTRRQAARRRRRRKRMLLAFVLVLACFPPMWPFLLAGWLIWRTRPPQKSMRRVRKAVRSLEKNRTGVALKHLQEAHLLDTSNPDALYWLGLVLSRQQRHEEAEQALSLVAERVPGLPEVEAALVETCLALDDPERAVYHAQRLLDVEPYALRSLLLLADAFEATGRPDLAIESLRKAPLHKRTLTAELVGIHYRLGVLHEGQGDAERALHHFKRVYARDAGYLDVRSRLQALEDDGKRP